MTDLFAPTIDDQIACVEREIRKRGSVYPRMVANKQMPQDRADREIALMREVLQTLLWAKENGR